MTINEAQISHSIRCSI